MPLALVVRPVRFKIWREQALCRDDQKRQNSDYSYDDPDQKRQPILHGYDQHVSQQNAKCDLDDQDFTLWLATAWSLDSLFCIVVT